MSGVRFFWSSVSLSVLRFAGYTVIENGDVCSIDKKQRKGAAL